MKASHSLTGPRAGATAAWSPWPAAAGIPYAEAHALLASIREDVHARMWEARHLLAVKCPRRRRWTGATTRTERYTALRHLGVAFEMVRLPRPVTLKTFVACFAEPAERYVVTTTGHVQVVRGTDVLDQCGVRPIGTYWGARKRVKEVLWLPR